MRKIRPLGNKILVSPVKRPPLASGLQVLEGGEWWWHANHFWVIDVGSKVKHCRHGDQIICRFDKDHSGYEPVLAMDPEHRGFISEEDVLAVLPRTPVEE